MTKYVDFVLCKRDMHYSNELFVAPAFSDLKKEDLVVVEPEGRDMLAKVMGVITLDQNDYKAIEFVFNATRTEGKPKRVLSKVNYEIFDYKEDDYD